MVNSARAGQPLLSGVLNSKTIIVAMMAIIASVKAKNLSFSMELFYHKC